MAASVRPDRAIFPGFGCPGLWLFCHDTGLSAVGVYCWNSFRRAGSLDRTVAHGPVRFVERSVTSRSYSRKNRRHHMRSNPRYKTLSDEDLKQTTAEFKKRLASGQNASTTSWSKPFAVCREASRRFNWAAPLRRAIARRYGPAHAGHCRNGDRRRQDARRHPAGVFERARWEGGPRRHGQQLPRSPRNGMDGPGLHGAGLTVGSIYNDMDPLERPTSVHVRHHLRHENEFGFDYLRRQHEAGRARRQSLPARPTAGAARSALRDSSTKSTTSSSTKRGRR